MKRTTLAILWHMHQPYYRDMVTGESTMPWVRLHATHSYYDMLRLYERFPNVHGTINFVPSLVDQLLGYVEGGKSDAFLEHTIVPAENLTPQQKVFILRYFFMANPEHKIDPYPAYRKLFTRRGLEPGKIDFQQAIRFFSTQDYLDLQVFYNLVWFGFTAREEIPEIDKMLASGGNFTEADKQFVIEAERRIIRNLLEAIRSASASQNVEICTTPYYHPIFPLLIDTNFAARALPKVSLPPRITMPQMAEAQLENALVSMGRWTGVRPKGLWPAEGSVCPEMIPMLSKAGVKWIATDDRILGRSLPGAGKTISQHQPFAAEFEGSRINMVFRDHGLADLISFTYSKMQAKTAVDDFLSNIKKIGSSSGDGEKLVTVILDGENAWEFYPESGKEFLTELFSTIEKEGISTSKIGSYIEDHPPKITLPELFTGSWIDANFNIWIGKPQKNQAWGYVKRVLDEIGDAFSSSRRRDDPQAARAFESFLAACGSDWFWWYDDDFDSAFKPDFDRIFRQHLKNAFTLLGRDIPLYLFEPIYQFKETGAELAEPAGFMEPSIDGKRTAFFEWANAIRYNVRGRGGAVALGSEPLETISFGFNTKAFFLRLDPANIETGLQIGDDDELIFYLHDGNKHHKFGLRREGAGFKMEMLNLKEDKPMGVAPVKWALCGVLEISVSFAEFGYKAGEKMTIAVALHRKGVEVRRYSHIHFVVPDETYEQRMWTV